MPHAAAFISVNAMDGVNAREFSFGSRAAVACSVIGRPDFPREQTIAAALQFGGPGQIRPS